MTRVSDDDIDRLREAGEQAAQALGLYVADICTAEGDDHTDIIIGRSYPTMRRIALSNQLGAELAAGGARAAQARAVIKAAFAGERVVFAAHRAAPTVPYGKGPTYLGEMSGFRGELDTLLNELAGEHPAVTFVICKELGRRWSRDPRDSTRFIELTGTWCAICGSDASGSRGSLVVFVDRTPLPISETLQPQARGRKRAWQVRTCKASACIEAARSGRNLKENLMARFRVVEYMPPNLLTLTVKPDLSQALEYLRAELAQNAKDQLEEDGGSVAARLFGISVVRGE